MEHLRQIQRAIDYIEDHLDGDLSTDSIAKVAGFSKWHFQIDQIPEGMMTTTIPAGNYAVFTHKGTIEKLSFTVNCGLSEA